MTSRDVNNHGQENPIFDKKIFITKKLFKSVLSCHARFYTATTLRNTSTLLKNSFFRENDFDLAPDSQFLKKIVKNVFC